MATALLDTVGLASGVATGGLSDIGLIASIGSTLIGAVGQLTSGSSSAAASRYNAEVAANNAQIAKQNATWAAHAGEQQVGEQAQKTRATVGAIKAAQAANNLDVNSGSAVDVRSSASELGELSALNIRSNAARTAYGYQSQSASDTAQSKLDSFQAQQEELAGEVGAGTSILGGFGSAALNYNNYLSSNSLSTA